MTLDRFSKRRYFECRIPTKKGLLLFPLFGIKFRIAEYRE